MDLIASLLGGLGLFLVGMKAVGANLQQLAGRRMRVVVAQATRGPIASAASGILLGGLTQSSNAVTFIAISMAQAGILTQRRAMPIVAFANVGTAGLVLLATVDIRLAVLWLIGVVGFMSALNLDRGGRMKPVLGALLGLGLLFLGLDLMKTGALPLRDLSLTRSVVEGDALGGFGLILPFIVGALITLVAQSSSTVTILAMTLNAAGLVSFDQAALSVYGASVGSGGAVLLLSSSLSGAARRLAVYQALVKAGGVALFLLLFLLERLGGFPAVLAMTEAIASDSQSRIGWLFLLLQLGSALLVAPFGTAMEKLLVRLSPETPSEALSRPHYLYDKALADPPTALDLVALEQSRLLDRLPGLVDPLRAEPEQAGTSRAALLVAGEALERSVAAFLTEVLARGCGRDQLDRAVALEAAATGLTALRQTLGEFGDSVEACRDRATPALLNVLQQLAESLHLLLGQLAAVAASGDAEDAAQLLALTADRSEMMDGLRRRVARADPDLAYGGQDLLFRATAQFERAVWLTRRQALMLASADTA